MVTRTEVIQSLKSRDEFQNRDIASVLDYLEQQASHSVFSTRDAILNTGGGRGRRRILGEVTNRDLVGIYNYCAELGQPAITERDFLNSLDVRRDIVSRDLVNHLLDLVDGSLFVPLNPFNWYDFQDLSTLFSDTALTTLIAGTLDEVINGVADKGSAGTEGDLDSNFGLATGPLFQPDVQGLGFRAAEFNRIDADEGQGLITKASTLDYGGDEGMVLIIGITHATPTASGHIFDGADDTEVQYLFQQAATTTTVRGSGGKASQSWTHVLGTLWAAWAHNGPLNFQRVSINQVAGVDTQSYSFNAAANSKIALGSRIQALNFGDVQILETLLWDADVSPVPTEAAVEAYATSRYGIAWA